jgi:hypothetical protein
MGGMGGMLGPAAALGAGGLMGKKMGKKNKKLLKYGLPLAGAGVGAYVLGKGMKKHKFGRHGSWSSSSSSSDSD